MRRRVIVILAVGLVGAGAAAWWYWRLQRRPGGAVKAGAAVAQVRRGAMRVTLTADGMVAAKESEKIAHKIESQGRLTIKEVVPEGTFAKKGQVLVRLDDTDLKRRLDQLKAEQRTAKNELDVAQVELTILARENKSALESAQVKLEQAKMELEKYEKAEAPQEERKLGLAIEQAESKLKRARDKYQEMPALLKEGFITQSDLEEARIALRAAEIELESARLDLERFKTYTHRINLASKKDALQRSQDEVDKTRMVNDNRLKQKTGAADTSRDKLAEVERNLEKAAKDLEAAVLTAPQDGLVLYGDKSSGRRFWSSGDDEIKVGTQVYQNRPIITLPNMQQLIVNTEVGEVDMPKVKKGLKARVTFDAFPGLSLEGKIVKVASVATQEWWGGDKNYQVRLELPPGNHGLKPGVTAKAEILVEELPDVLQVPVSAVFVREGRSLAYVRGPSGLHAVEVKLGRVTDTMAEIRSGLSEGQEVLLHEPEGVPVPPKAAQSANAGPEGVKAGARGAAAAAPPAGAKSP
jgi:HlyD family secretion protein